MFSIVRQRTCRSKQSLALRAQRLFPGELALSPFHRLESSNLPLLHRKEAFLRPDDQRHPKFARLTAQEVKHGLLDDASAIGTRTGWARRLTERGLALKGHRLVKSTVPQPDQAATVEAAS
jgi:hypothetical protein